MSWGTSAGTWALARTTVFASNFWIHAKKAVPVVTGVAVRLSDAFHREKSVRRAIKIDVTHSKRGVQHDPRNEAIIERGGWTTLVNAARR